MVQSNILIRSKINKAQDLLQQNRLSEARILYEQLCGSRRNDIDLWLTLAIINRRMGLFNEADTACRQALSLQKDHALAHHIAGSIQQCLGNIDAAISSYKTAITLDASHAETYYFLGNALQTIGQSFEAAENYRRAVNLKPGYLEALGNLGAVLISLHRFDEARRVLEMTNRLYPNREQILCNLGDLSMLEDHLEQAMSYANSALTINPRFFDAHYLLGRIHRQQQDYDQALYNFNNAMNIQPSNENIIGSIAEILEIRGEFALAQELLQPLIQRKTGNPLVLKAYSALTRSCDREREATRILEEAIAKGGLDISNQIRLHSELGKQYDRLEDYPQAFEHYKRANILERELNKQIWEKAGPVHASREEIKIWHSRYGYEFWRQLPRSGALSTRPIFVIGMPRSGTTLAEQILSSHPDIYGAGELPDMQDLAQQLGDSATGIDPFQHLARLSQQVLGGAATKYLKTLDQKSPETLRVVDKMPMNFWHLGIISLLFPNASVIHMTRDPRDTCLSVYFQRFSSSMSFTTDLMELAAYYLAYAEVMRYWKTVLDIEIMELRYEDLVSDQERVIRKMIEYCGLQWDDRCLHFYLNERDVHTPSYDQVRRPMYDKSIGRWKNYERQLAPLTTAMGLDL
jgi:tetratricopeptide (TPR) repeat protein